MYFFHSCIQNTYLEGCHCLELYRHCQTLPLLALLGLVLLVQALLGLVLLVQALLGLVLLVQALLGLVLLVQALLTLVLHETS